MKCFKLLATLAIMCLTAASVHADEWQTIFDGKTLKGWDGDPKFWSVKDGAITGTTTKENPTKGNTFIIWTGGELADFELKLQYRIIKGNSGIQYRSFKKPGNHDGWRIGGYQADFEAGDRYSGICYGEAFRGILADRGQKVTLTRNENGKIVKKAEKIGVSAEIGKAVKKEDWNEYHIIAKGFHFVHKINGVTTCELIDEDKKMRRASGLLALQLHQGPPMVVQFKDIKVKHLKKSAAGTSTDTVKSTAATEKKKIVFVAGHKSHGFGSHDHKAGCHLLAKQLEASGLPVECVIHYPGWPTDESIFDGADAVVIYSDGGGRHPAIRRPSNAKTLDALVAKGVGVGCIHYAVEVPRGSSGKRMLNWTGGYFETNWSVNPHWRTTNVTLAKGHPITNGVMPFEMQDEWYYHMRFREGMKNVTPILSALPPESSLKRKDGAHSNNPHVRKSVLEEKKPQHLMWAVQRDDGGRGFGFTGSHFHWNWVNDNHRRLVLNGIVWIAGLDVPQNGVRSKTPTLDDMLENHDDAPPAEKINREQLQKKLDSLNPKQAAE